jgi:hypothetical protein
MDPFNQETIESLVAASEGILQKPSIILEYEDWLLSSSTKTAKRKIHDILRGVERGDFHLNGETAELVAATALLQVFTQEEVDLKFGSTRFPDAIVKTDYGVEIKYIGDGHETLGNSSVQSDPGVEEIYTLVFTNQGTVVFKKYEELITGIKVDHNPRFGLSLSHGESFKDTIGISLVEFMRLPDEQKHGIVRDYLREKSGGRDWMWYLGEQDSQHVIELLGKLKRNWESIDRDELRIAVFALALDTVNRSNYDDLVSWVVTNYECYGPIKDCFTAGGTVLLESNQIRVPRIFYHFDNLLPKIVQRLISDGIDQNKWIANATEWIEAKIDSPQNGLSRESADYLLNRIQVLINREAST